MLPSIESIKQQRLKINMTQKELANLVGVSTSMINQIESGRSAPSYNTAKRIFEVLASKESEASAHNAGELCSQKIVKLKPTNTLGEAMVKMDKEKISQIPIFDTLRFCPSLDTRESDYIRTSLISYPTSFIRFTIICETSIACVMRFPRATIVTIDKDANCVKVAVTYDIMGLVPMKMVL